MKVSVSVITYNHEKFICQALDSVLMQQVDFPYEIVIGEDLSTDNTRTMLLNYRDKYPDRIRLLFSEKNLGVVRNFVRTYGACKGEYVATLDGDDYWTSPNKLQRQVEFLDRHRDFSLCFHPVKHFFDGDDSRPGFLFPKHPKPVFSIEDLLDSNIIPTCSVMFRNRLFDQFPDWYHTLSMEDWPLYLMIAQYGKIGCLDDVMGAYRMHGESIWSSKTKVYTYQEDIKFYKSVDSHLKFRYHGIVKRKLAEYHEKLSLLYETDGDIANARSFAIKSFFSCPFGKDVPWKERCKSIVRLYNPVLYNFFKKVKHRRTIP